MLMLVIDDNASNTDHHWNANVLDQIRSTWNEWVRVRNRDLATNKEIMDACGTLREATNMFKQLHGEVGSADQAAANITKLLGELQEQRKEIEELRRKINTAKADNDILRGQASGLEAAYEQSEHAVASQAARASQLEADLRAKAAALEVARQKVTESSMQIDRANQELHCIRDNYSSSLDNEQGLIDLLEASFAWQEQLQKQHQSLLTEPAASRVTTSLINQTEQTLTHASDEATEIEELKARIQELEQGMEGLQVQAAADARDRAEENARSKSTEQRLRKGLEQAEARLGAASNPPAPLEQSRKRARREEENVKGTLGHTVYR